MTKHPILTLLALGTFLLATVALAAPGSPAAKGGPGPRHFGAPITVKKPVDLARLAKNPARFAGRQVRLEGTVKEVCQGRGCWVEVESKGASFLARSLDESVLLPRDCKGRRIVVQGVVKALPPAAKQEPVEEGHACPKPAWVVATEGAFLGD